MSKYNHNDNGKGGFSGFEEAFASIKPLIFKLSYVTNQYGIEQEDLFQELSIKAFYCWTTWDPDRGVRFITYVLPALTRRRSELIRKTHSKRMGGGVAPASIFDVANKKQAVSDADAILLVDVLPSGEEPIDSIVCHCDIIDAIYDILDEKFPAKKVQQMIIDVLMGVAQTEVAAKNGVKQSLVSYYMKRFRMFLKERLVEGGYDLSDYS